MVTKNANCIRNSKLALYSVEGKNRYSKLPKNDSFKHFGNLFRRFMLS